VLHGLIVRTGSKPASSTRSSTGSRRAPLTANGEQRIADVSLDRPLVIATRFAVAVAYIALRADHPGLSLNAGLGKEFVCSDCEVVAFQNDRRHPRVASSSVLLARGPVGSPFRGDGNPLTVAARDPAASLQDAEKLTNHRFMLTNDLSRTEMEASDSCTTTQICERRQYEAACELVDVVAILTGEREDPHSTNLATTCPKFKHRGASTQSPNAG